jgi:hypothetical protein
MQTATRLRPVNESKPLPPLPVLTTKKYIRKVFSGHSTAMVEKMLKEALHHVSPEPTKEQIQRHTVTYNEILYIVANYGPLPDYYDPFEKVRMKGLI